MILFTTDMKITIITFMSVLLDALPVKSSMFTQTERIRILISITLERLRQFQPNFVHLLLTIWENTGGKTPPTFTGVGVRKSDMYK